MPVTVHDASPAPNGLLTHSNYTPSDSVFFQYFSLAGRTPASYVFYQRKKSPPWPQVKRHTLARDILEPGEFIEVFVDTPLAVAEARDVKGLYKKARAGQLKNFTGVDSPYEAPESPELRIDTTAIDPVEAAEQIVAWLEGQEADYTI